MSRFDAVDLWLRDSYACLTEGPVKYGPGLQIKRDRMPAEVEGLVIYMATPDIYITLKDHLQYYTASNYVTIVLPGLRDIYFAYRNYLSVENRNEVRNIIEFSEQPSFHEADYYPYPRRAEETGDLTTGYLAPDTGVNGETILLGRDYNEIERSLLAGWLGGARQERRAIEDNWTEPRLDIDPVFPVVNGLYLYGSLSTYDTIVLTVPEFVQVLNKQSYMMVELPGLPISVRLHFDTSDFYDERRQRVCKPIIMDY